MARMTTCGTFSEVTMYLVSFLFVELLLLSLANGATEEAYVTLARCRVECLKEFVPKNKHNDDNSCWDTNNYRSGYNKHCYDCWDLCKTFAASPTFMAHACGNKKRCGAGCQSACDFIKHKPKANRLQGSWMFPDDITSMTDPIEMKIEWKPPVLVAGSTNLTSSNTQTGPIVYVLATRNNNRPQDGWQVVQQLVSNAIRIEMDAVPLSPEFLLLAVSESGLMCQKAFKTESLVFADIDDPSGPELRKLRASEEPGWYVDAMKGINTSLTFSTNIIGDETGSFKTQMAEVKFRGPDWLGQDIEHFYALRWFFMDCNHAYDFVPSCSLPRDDYGAIVGVKGSEEATYLIQNLRFNSMYLVVIYLAEDYRVKTEVVLKTEPCLQPDSLQLTQCLDDIEEEKLPSVPIKLVEGPAFEPEVTRLVVNITSMTLEPNSDEVVVNLTWSPVMNQTVVSYNVTTFTDRINLAVARHQVSHPFILLTLKQDTQYLVKVEAVLKPHFGDAPEAMNLADTVQFNTSDVNLAIYQGPQAFRLKNEDEMDQVDGIIIGVTCFIIIFVLAALATILYKKRKSFKDIIVTKATVAKSNSYKSNVGGKSDYSNQLIVFTDEWELDPLRLKFSTLLGQGAFGKVVTGYYDDQKVAIKLVREGAPVSYKEDLVAEINLMKRLGSHPNIVCLIGACTLSEPIALIMEYVPYGNLQNFLKKCRMEGDLRKPTDGPTEITYTMVQESGSMESGVVTPADMLSFARQVSMAMEYLTEKKYVHRDLAARNVLIDYNKVVKVCDFGLSRDIFNDNHYKKLTNGKLPLKWMAIESLRDRMFTTQSDVWSFGILLWEIVTMGASPYPNVALADLYYVLSNGYRMDRPSNCSQALYNIMRSCWEEEPDERPNFIQLRMMLEDLLTEDRDYLVLEDIDVPLTNSDNSSSPSQPPFSDASPSSLGPIGATAGPLPYPTTSTTSSDSSHPTKAPRKVSPRKDSMRINVCIHQKSTDRLIRPSESDSSPSSC